MQQIYVIEGCVDQPDSYPWLVCAYTNEDDAIKHVNRLKAEIDAIQVLEAPYYDALEIARQNFDNKDAYYEAIRVYYDAVHALAETLSDKNMCGRGPYLHEGIDYQIISIQLHENEHGN